LGGGPLPKRRQAAASTRCVTRTETAAEPALTTFQTNRFFFSSTAAPYVAP
jgi:hypothetical protein